MPDKWTGDFVARMHLAGVRRCDIAKEAGVTRAYISMILNGKRKPAGAQERLEAALAKVKGGRT